MKEDLTKQATSTVARGGEVYAWLDQCQSPTSFAFVVIYLGRQGRRWFGKKTEGCWVALHRKQADIDADFFDCVDALKPAEKIVSYGATERHEFPTPDKAINFAVARFAIKEFVDYDAINQRYRDTYLKG